MMSKNLYIISGCNGAGKTTASYTVLPQILECKEFIRRRYVAGLKNLFERFADEVDLWMIYDNSRSPRTFVAQGGKVMNTTIASEVTYNKMKHYV